MIPLVVALGMGSAFVFGAGDFLGGLASKRISSVRVTGIAGVSGLAILWLMYPLFGGAWTWSAILFGGLSGVSGAAAIVLLYRCLAIGPMSILSPVTAVVSAIVPAAVGIVIQHERFGVFGYVALGLTLVAIVLVGFARDERAVRPTAQGLLMAVASGVFIGGFIILIDLTPTDSGLVPLIANRTVNSALMWSAIGVIAIVARRRASVDAGADAPAGNGWRPGLRLAIACGAVDGVANSGLLFGIRIGDLSIIAVLTALYPAGTIILAAVILRERIATVQYVGLALAIVGGALLALD